MNFLQKRLRPELHLTDEQLYSVLDGSPEPATTSHLLICAGCADEVTSLRASLENLRIVTSEYASATTPSFERPAAAVRQRPSLARPVWTVSLATGVALLAVSIAHTYTRQAGHANAHIPVASTSTETAASAPADSDEALLEGIDRDLATSIPPSLAPLAPPRD